MRALVVAGVVGFLVCSGVAALEPPAVAEESAKPAAVVTDFARLKSLAGEWIDTTGTSAGKGEIAAVYRVTSGGSVVQETLFPGTDHEMVSMYTAAGREIVMSHYCAMGNQPRMRAPVTDSNTLVFAFDGGGVTHPDKDMHMHNGLIRFDDSDRIYAEWQTWQDGKPGEHKAQFTLQRKTRS